MLFQTQEQLSKQLNEIDKAIASMNGSYQELIDASEKQNWHKNKPIPCSLNHLQIAHLAINKPFLMR